MYKNLLQVRSPVYCAAVREGVTGAEDFLEERLLATALPQERDAIEDALTSAACAPAGVTRDVTTSARRPGSKWR